MVAEAFNNRPNNRFNNRLNIIINFLNKGEGILNIRWDIRRDNSIKLSGLQQQYHSFLGDPRCYLAVYGGTRCTDALIKALLLFAKLSGKMVGGRMMID